MRSYDATDILLHLRHIFIRELKPCSRRNLYVDNELARISSREKRLTHQGVYRKANNEDKRAGSDHHAGPFEAVPYGTFVPCHQGIKCTIELEDDVAEYVSLSRIIQCTIRVYRRLYLFIIVVRAMCSVDTNEASTK